MNCAARIPKIPANFLKFLPLKADDQGGFPNGFTLVEVIVTILIAAIMGAFFIQFMGTAMSRSVRAIENVRDEASAERIMEQIVADYVAEINKADPISALGTMIANNSNPINKYGINTVTMSYINFSPGGAEQPSGGQTRTLKVTVQAPGSNLITLLTESRQAGPPDSPPVAY
jgi:prepilin-type N-terminal cleavage/methylation domain-containing protein